MEVNLDDLKSRYVGQELTDDLLVAIKIETGFSRYRVLGPFAIITADSDTSRLNIDIDDNNIITNFDFG